MGLTTGATTASTASTVGTIGTTAQVAGAGVSAIGAYTAGKSAQLALRAQAVMAELNARVSEQSAQQELAKGNDAVAKTTAQAGQLKSAQRAALAANGVDLGFGSSTEILATTDMIKSEDVDTLTANAVRAAWGYRTQGANHQNEAAAKRTSAASINPGLSASTSLLGSAGGIASSWYSANKAGAKKE